MEKIQETTPEKKKSKGKKDPQFGEVPELPSDDDDDEYDPSKDACDISDEESLASASDTDGNTPLSSQTKKSLTKNDNNVFKKPQDAIATTSGSSVVRSLDRGKYFSKNPKLFRKGAKKIKNFSELLKKIPTTKYSGFLYFRIFCDKSWCEEHIWLYP